MFVCVTLRSFLCKSWYGGRVWDDAREGAAPARGRRGATVAPASAPEPNPSRGVPLHYKTCADATRNKTLLKPTQTNQLKLVKVHLYLVILISTPITWYSGAPRLWHQGRSRSIHILGYRQ